MSHFVDTKHRPFDGKNISLLGVPILGRYIAINIALLTEFRANPIRAKIVAPNG